MGHARGEIVVTALESGPCAMEKLGCNNQESLSREALSNVADMRIHAEGFLHYQQPARRRRSCRACHIQPHRGAVAHFCGNKLALDLHEALLKFVGIFRYVVNRRPKNTHPHSPLSIQESSPESLLKVISGSSRLG